MKRLFLFVLFVAVVVALAGEGLMHESHSARATGGPTVIATIPVGDGAFGVGVNPNTNRIYASNGRVDNVSVIDGDTNAVSDTVTIGAAPRGLTVNPHTNRVYAAASNDGYVAVINGATNSVLTTIPIGQTHMMLGVNPSTNRIYSANEHLNTVSVIDGVTNAVVATVPVGDHPQYVGVNPNTDLVYVSNSESNTVSVIDGATNAVVSTIPVGIWPHGVGVNPNTNRIYVANNISNMVSVIDGATNAVVTTVPVGDRPRYVDVNPITNRIYVADYYSDTVSVIDGATDTVVASVPVGDYPVDVAVNPGTNRIYVTNWVSNTVSVIEDIVDRTPPEVTIASLAPNPAGVSEVPLLEVTATDDLSNIMAMEYFLDVLGEQGTGTAMPASDGGYDELAEDASTTLLGLQVGVHTIYVRAQDAAGNWSDPSVAFLVIYDPSAGFATGGGWLIPGGNSSDPGDVLPGLTGSDKANFGFVVKYHHGATTPDGQLQFRYRVGNFNLHSSGYDWLIVTNSNWAKFQGTATIKGFGDGYPFRVDVRDGNLNGGSQADRFIIKVWSPGANPDTGEPLYKASGDIEGGNVLIHN